MPIRIFLADDHAIVRDGLRFLLEAQSDLRVVGDAADGRTALRQIVSCDPDIAILDISMPELNGIETAAHIQEEAPRTRVIMLSMHSTSEHVFRALQAGALGYVLKEAAGKELVDAVRAVAGGRRFLSARIEPSVIDDALAGGPRRDLAPIERLSPREREILQLVVEGRSSAEIAELIFLSPKSVETYRSRLMQKLGVGDVPSLVKFAIQHGLTTLG